MEENIIAKRLFELRTIKKVSAREMSLSIGQSENYINSIENGKTLPSMTVFSYICEYFKISPAEFFDHDSKNPAELRKFIEKVKMLDFNEFDSLDRLADIILKYKK